MEDVVHPSDRQIGVLADRIHNHRGKTLLHAHQVHMNEKGLIIAKHLDLTWLTWHTHQPVVQVWHAMSVSRRCHTPGEHLQGKGQTKREHPELVALPLIVKMQEFSVTREDEHMKICILHVDRSKPILLGQTVGPRLCMYERG